MANCTQARPKSSNLSAAGKDIFSDIATVGMWTYQTAGAAMSPAVFVKRACGGEGRRKMTEPSASRSVS